MSASSDLGSPPSGPNIDYQGHGPQTAHLGRGDQNVNASEGVQNINAPEGQLFNIQKFFHFAGNPALENFDVLRLPHDQEGALSHPIPRQKTSSVSEVIGWLRRKADTQGPRSLLSQRRIHRSLVSRRTPGTGDWLLRNETFLEWRNGFGNVLWLDGIMGSGKSVLASMVMDHLKDACDEEGRSTCVYVYFHDEDEGKPTLESLYANILEQLLERINPEDEASGPLQEFCQKCQSDGASLPFEEYCDLLSKEAKLLSKVFLVVDGLDTYEDPDHRNFQDLFIRAARQLYNWNILLTSRVGTFTEGRSDVDYKLEIDALDTARDIKLYVNKRIERSNSLSRMVVAEDNNFKNHVLDTIVQKAKGMFLLAKMHMDSLESQKLLANFKLVLGKLPESKGKTFEAALQRIQGKEVLFRDMASHTLTWVSCSAQPVTVDEVRDAYAVRQHPHSLNRDYLPSEEQLISSCAGIVVVDSQTGILRPAHEAVMDHVQKSGLLPCDSHQHMALQCLDYLSFEDFARASNSEDIAHYSQQYPLLVYAAKHWFNHFHKAERSGNLENRALEFLQCSDCVSFSTQARLPSRPRGASGLHVCASLGESHLAKKLLEKRMSIRSTTEAQETPLHWAVQFGHLAVAQLFLEYWSSVDARDNQGNTALHIAVYRKERGEDMVKLLIQARASVDIQNTQGFTPLHWCLKYGLVDKAMPLISHMADADVEGSKGLTPLRLALWYGQLELVKVMIENGCNINKQGSKDGWSILHHAVWFGYEPLTRFLLEHKAEVDLRDKYGLTPLRWAIGHSKSSLAKLLLDHGADVNAISNDKTTALIQATIQAIIPATAQAKKRGFEHAVWLLISHNPTLDDQDRDGNTALHYAARYGQKSILWLLVEEGASLDVQNSDGRTPLHEVLETGNMPMAWYLILKGANVCVADVQGREAGHLAALHGLGIILELMWEHGATFNKRNNRGLTPLHHAAVLGHESLVYQLLRYGAESALQDGEGLTALHHAVQNANASDMHHRIILKLGKTGSCLDQQDNNGQTPLMHAAIRGDKTAIVCLNTCGANKTIRDAQDWTAKDHAARGRHTGVMDYL